MAASSSDLLTQATVNSRPTPTTLSSTRSAAGTTLSCLALTGWPTTTKVHFVTYRINSSGAKVAGSQCDWAGVVSGTTITNLVLKAGTDVGNSVADVVEAAPTAAYANDLYSWGVVNHDSLGNHKDLTATNSKTVLGLTDGASTVNNLRATSAVTGAGPTLASEGTDSNVDFNINAKGTGIVKVSGAAPKQFFQNAMFDFVESGVVITADSVGVNKNYSISSGVVWIAGKRLTVAAVSAQTVAASKDRYVDLRDNSDGTATYITNEVANNAASQALTAGDMRVGIVVAGATTIATTASINQGQEDRVLPIASSIPYAVTDSLGNLICPRDPNRKVLGYRQSLVDFTTVSTSAVQITGLTCPVIVPTGRKVKITVECGSAFNGAANSGNIVSIWDGVVASGTQLGLSAGTTGTASTNQNVTALAMTTPAATSKTYNGGFACTGANQAHTNGTTGQPVFILVELA